MGYELHITRREHWAEEETEDISFDEWVTYVNNDRELNLTNRYDIKIGSETWFHNSPGFCEWNAHPTKKQPNEKPWFSYWKGCIDTKNPDTPTIGKMIQIAAALNAKVLGDDGEIYTEEYFDTLVNEEKRKTTFTKQQKKAWWKFW